MLSNRELLISLKGTRYEDDGRIMARFIIKNESEIIAKLEKAGYSQISIDKLRDCLNFPSQPTNTRYMRRMLMAI